MKVIVEIEQIKDIAQELLRYISKKKQKSATIIALSGELGAGKTTLTQEISRLLGVKNKVVSPTFVIMKKYEIPNGEFKNLIHIDAYRLKNSQELLKLNWDNLNKNPDNLIIIEWPEIVKECLSENTTQIILKHKNEKTRSFEILV